MPKDMGYQMSKCFMKSQSRASQGSRGQIYVGWPKVLQMRANGSDVNIIRSERRGGVQYFICAYSTTS